MQPLEGIRVIDLTRLLPFTSWLADMGAEVIKVEEPEVGDYSRWFPPTINGQGAYFMLVHRNKKSLTLNLKSDKGKEVFRKLVRVSDVVIESFRPGVSERLGVDYKSVKEVNPKIVYCSVSGYGQTGPYRNFPGHDINYIALGGVLALTGRKGEPPVVPGTQIADLGSCLLATVAILSALIFRSKTGEGQYIDISMTDTAISWMTIPSAFYFAGFEVERGELPVLGGFPCYGVYETKDGKYISVGCLEEHFWVKLCKVLGREEYGGYQWDMEKRDEIFNSFREIFKTKTRDEWFSILAKEDICVAPVYSLQEVFSDSHVLEREMVLETEHPRLGKIKQIGFPVKFSKTPCEFRRFAPLLGEHTVEILKQLGYRTEEIDEMKKSGVI